MQKSEALQGNATMFFDGTDFCGAAKPPAGLTAEDCKGFNKWFTPKAFNILGQVVALTDTKLCHDVYGAC